MKKGISFEDLKKVFEEDSKFRKEKETKLHNNMVKFFDEIKQK